MRSKLRRSDGEGGGGGLLWFRDGPRSKPEKPLLVSKVKKNGFFMNGG